MSLIQRFALVSIAFFACFGHAKTLDEMWFRVEVLSPFNIFENVEIRTNNSIQYPAQISITEEKAWIEVNEEIKKHFSTDQFEFILFHEVGHLYLDHQKLLEEAELKNPGVGDQLRKEFVLESDQFATLVYLKFMKPWLEIEDLEKKMLERNTSGAWIPSAEDRVNAINLARDFYFSKMKTP